MFPRCYSALLRLILLFAVGLVVACTGQSPISSQISASEIRVAADSILVSQEVGLTLEARGTGLQFQWTAIKGQLSSSTSASVIYTAPDSPGPDTVTVVVTSKGGDTIVRSKTFQIAAPPTIEPAPTSSPAPTSAPTPDIFIVETMSNVSGWDVFTNGNSSLDISLVPGRTDSAIKIAYDLAQGGWVGISRQLEPGVLSGTRQLQFYYYKVSGSPNTLELKLLYKPDSSGKGPVFSVSRREAASGGDWALFEAAYDAFACGATCPAPGARLDVAQVWKIEFAVSHQLGGSPGKGEVILDDVQAVR